MTEREVQLRMRPGGVDYYCLGFIFNSSGLQVLLQKKSDTCSIPSLRGKWNGIGGKVEADETFEEAMSREGMEEAGMNPPWRRCGTILIPRQSMPNANVVVFSAVVLGFPAHPPCGTEQLELWHMHQIPLISKAADHLHWLVPAAWEFRARSRFSVDMRER